MSMATSQQKTADNPTKAELDDYLQRQHPVVAEQHITLGSTRVRIVIRDKGYLPLIRNQLPFILTENTQGYDATLVVWQLPDNGAPVDPEKPLRVFYECDDDSRTYYFAASNLEPETFILEGHIFVLMFNRIIQTVSKPLSRQSSLVHGAAIGLDNFGALVCARGQRGKSTLAVTAMLDGMDYVSDDYLVLEKEKDGLYADPIYSIIALSPRMYNTLFDELDGCRFLTNNGRRDKYIINIAPFHYRFRRHYPIKVGLFPEIVPGSHPAVIPCTPQEKGRAINQFAHSTFIQMLRTTPDLSVMKQLISMVDGLPFYKITLSGDIHANAACLKDFLNQLKTGN